MIVDRRGYQLVIAEAAGLTSKPAMTKAEQRRFAFLQMAAASMREGATLAELDQERLNEDEMRHGIRPTRLAGRTSLTPELRAKAAFMQRLVNFSEPNEGHEGMEFRDGETVGNPIPQIGTYSGLGVFVPTDMYNSIFNAMAWYDPLYDPDVCQVIKSVNGRPLRVPVYDDITNVAVQVSEAGADGGEVLLGHPGQVTLGGFSFRSPIQKYSIEAVQDIQEAATAYEIFQKMASDRLARGIGKKLITGAGTTEPLGIVAALAAAGVTPITAKGRNANTGISGDTGANSIGSADLADLYYSVNEAYRIQPKCGWLLNDTTLTGLAAMVTKQGLPLVSYIDGQPTILGKPVYVCPGLASPSEGDVSVIFGDLGYWCTRLIAEDGVDRVMVYKQRYAELGQVGLQVFARADGALLFDSGVGADCPLNYIVNHS